MKILLLKKIHNFYVRGAYVLCDYDENGVRRA